MPKFEKAIIITVELFAVALVLFGLFSLAIRFYTPPFGVGVLVGTGGCTVVATLALIALWNQIRRTL